MDLLDWFPEFRLLNARVRAGEKLGPEEERLHRRGSAQVMRLLVAAQRLTVAPGERARHSLRVAWPHPVEFKLLAENVQAMTLDVSRGGFAALFQKAPPLLVTQSVEFRLELGAGHQALTGVASLLATSRRQSSYRTAFKFKTVSEASLRRLDALILDTILEHFRFWLGEGG